MSQITDPNARAAIRDWIAQQHEEMGRSSYYQLLGVQRTAPEKDIRDAYYRLVARFHPDLYVDTLDVETRQKLVSLYSRLVEAYRILTDGARREQYNAMLGRGKLRWSLEEAPATGPREPDGGEIRDANARRLFKLARQALMAGNAKGAVMNLKMALTVEPQNALLKAELAKAEAQLKTQGG